MEVKYLGHSSLLITVGGKNIIVDPFITANPNASSIDVNTLNIDYVLLTHAHYDHVWDVEAIVDRTKAPIIANHEIYTYYNTNKKYEGFAMNQGGTLAFDFGSLTAVNAIHSSSFSDGTYGGNPLGFILKGDGKTLYISGDTDLTMDMKLIPMFHQLDMAILSIGDVFTMDVKKAVVASEFIECNRIMGVHFDTMPLIAIDHEASIQMFADKGKELILPKIADIIKV